MRATTAVLPNRPSSQKSPRVPVLGYNHTLSVDEIVGRMIGYKPQEVPYNEVLDCFVEEAEVDYARAVKRGATEEELAVLKAEIDRRAQIRIHAMNLCRELNTAADEIAQGLEHPYLVLSRIEYVRGLRKFTVTSVYNWAKLVHGLEITEWAPQTEDSLAVEQTTERLYDGAQDVEKAGNEEEVKKKRLTAHRNLQVTIHIMAHALAGMVDQLAKKGHIHPPCKESCLEDDKSLNLSALWKYVASDIDLPSSPAESTTGTVGDPHFPTMDVSEAALAVLAKAFANLAERARAEKWLRYVDIHEVRDHRPFKTAADIYVSNRIYDYLAKTQLILESAQERDGNGRAKPKRTIKSQSSRAIQQRLNSARKHIPQSSSPKITLQQLLDALTAAIATHKEYVPT